MVCNEVLIVFVLFCNIILIQQIVGHRDMLLAVALAKIVAAKG
jgi:hypothetical protein